MASELPELKHEDEPDPEELFREHVERWDRLHRHRMATCQQCREQFEARPRGRLPRFCPTCRRANR